MPVVPAASHAVIALQFAGWQVAVVRASTDKVLVARFMLPVVCLRCHHDATSPWHTLLDHCLPAFAEGKPQSKAPTCDLFCRTAASEEREARSRVEKKLLLEQKALSQAEHQLRDKENISYQAIASAKTEHLALEKDLQGKLVESGRQLKQMQDSHQHIQQLLLRQDQATQNQVCHVSSPLEAHHQVHLL